MLVLAAIEHQPSARRFPGVAVLHAPLDDHLEPLTIEEVLLVRVMGRMVAEAVVSGAVVLVTCRMGINRSGIITAAALCELGFTPQQAERQVKCQRPGALINRSFVAHLPVIVQAGH
jgi:protein-tyrosine phosphatase